MEVTKEQLEELRNDPVTKRLASFLGLDLDKEIDEFKAKSKPEEATFCPHRVDPFGNMLEDVQKNIENGLAALEAKGKIKSYEKDGVKYYYTPEEKSKEIVEETKKEPAHTFVMSKEDFVTFCKDYRQLIEAKNKLNYLFGIDITDDRSGFSFAGKVQEIIWSLINVIFGEDNRDDIANFIYGNSNFDNPADLYEELL